MENIGCFIIHLQRAEERQLNVARLSASLPIKPSIINAVDGRQLTDQQRLAYRPRLFKPFYPFVLLPGEIATFHSYRRCWQTIVDQGLSAALVIEDDTILEPDLFSEAFQVATETLRPGDYVRFPVKLRERSQKVSIQNDRPNLIDSWSIGLETNAQIITHAAAETLLIKTIQFDRPIDTYLQTRWHHGLSVRTVWPSGVTEISADLGGSLIGKRRGFWDRLSLETLRPIYKLQLHLMLLLTRMSR